MNSHKPFICISICEDDFQSLQHAFAEVAREGALVELRLDCLASSELDKNLAEIDRLVQAAHCVTILTYRPAAEGGRKPLDLEQRISFWSNDHPSSLVDLEFELASNNSISEAIDWNRVICSYHNFDGLPAVDIFKIYEQMAATRARVLKIAVHANDIVDCLPIFELLDRARLAGREMIALAMGTSGVATRILGPSRGAFLTYAAVDDESATAPGQLSGPELKEIYRIEQISRTTNIFGLMGHPVAHSRSPRVHNAAFEAAGFDAVFLPFDVSDAGRFLQRMVHPRTREIDWNLSGLSVTAPHKAAVIDHLDWLEPTAKEIGAVNTIVVDGNSLRGFNTDLKGFILPLVQRLGTLQGLRCAVIGSGGAASSAVWGLKNAGAEVSIFARNMSKAEMLATKRNVALAELEGASFAGFDVVVNATPLGTSGLNEGLSVATAEQLRDAGLAYDLVYNPHVTQFLREARDAGCKTLGGIEMFVTQAQAQFRLWTGVEAPEAVMRAVVS